MGLVLLLLFLAIPVVEIAVFIRVGDWIGLWPTLALIILTALLGSWQLRLQGMATLARARRQMDQGEIPTRELFDGVCLLAAGALLLTPGFVTDLVGASLFLPPVRRWLRRAFARHLEARARAGNAGTRIFVNGEEIRPGEPGPAGPRSRWGRGAPPGTIEGEWTEVGDEETPAGGSAEVLPGPGRAADEPDEPKGGASR
ncbi:UPF0716 protein FxsA [Tistlia consotensis]|uniref:UPF0716 protein FxsA n=1 Tax=Tistlia consotensis USBA 355 TaxID=560819 RepID=A0A1Y6BL83_9PROT|nr:FxsA family protein [Tistlia consotensis]SMF08924.1 UPF0716 protein FxsA [Tistlia consotensis USBA 355]SNR35014.1 UPF0716 protein FxsA [Tistlia consotensis]